jgi:alkanesulfonate monooxygenase SsuD/methylene tetrahydromethanopterin reductase-like flavin-dependent oxidoreductase (luciferase family)
MRIDLVLPSESAQDDPRSLAELAAAAENLGFGAVWLPDHLLPPHGYDRTYGGVHEPVVSLAFLAAHTRRIKLGTSVLIAPLREPILLAKQIGTLAGLAPGRILLGVGTGWQRSEFDALRVDFAHRGTLTDNALTTLRHLHTTGLGPDGGVFAPTPDPQVPIVVGGTSAPALRRAAHFGDLWQAVGRTPEQFTADRRHLRRLAGRAVPSGARISWEPDQPLPELLAEIDRWRAAEPEHLAIWIGALGTAATRIAELAAALPTPPG